MKRQVAATGALWVATIVMAGCSKPGASGINVNEAFKPLISASTTVMAGIDLDALKSSPLYAKYNSDLNLRGMEQFGQEFGIDPARDLRELLYVSDGKKQWFMARGTLRGPEIERKLQGKGFKTSTYKGFHIWGDGQNALVLLKGPLAVMGTAESVREAIDTNTEGRGEVPEQIADTLRSIPKGDQVWLVSRSGLPFAAAATRTEIRSALSNIVDAVKTTVGSLHLDSGVRLQAALGCVSPDGATRVNDALRGTIAIGRLSTRDNEASLLKMYDAVQIERKENNVRVDAQLTGEQVEELVSRFLKH